MSKAAAAAGEAGSVSGGVCVCVTVVEGACEVMPFFFSAHPSALWRGGVGGTREKI